LNSARLRDEARGFDMSRHSKRWMEAIMNPLSVVESVPSPVTQQPANRLLASLPSADYQRLLPDLKYRPLKVRQVLAKSGDRLTEVYFPERSLCSIVTTMDDGASAEVAMVGDEGMIGIGAVLGEPITSGDVVVQAAGHGAYALGLDAFDREMDRGGAFRDVMTKYAQAFVGLLTQAVACNGLHSADERCCRWLLMTHDRLGTDEFNVTHEMLSMMLGVRRPTITLVLAQLAKAGMISQVRGRIRIVDRRALESASCECYRTVRNLFDRLLPLNRSHETLQFPTRLPGTVPQF
jgi:CRP-like cAMP-binding protein